MSDVFERATKQRLRFSTSISNITTEDLWGLNLEQLDKLAIAYNKQLQEEGTSFIHDKTQTSAKLQLQFDVVKRVIDVRLEEQEAAKAAAEVRQRRKALLEALADQEEAALKSKSREDLLKELEELNKK